MRPISTDEVDNLAMLARAAELRRIRKAELARMHHANGGLMGLPVYLRWSKDELVNAVLEDEGHCWHPGQGAAE